MEFRVWAPDAGRVELDLAGRRIAMAEVDGGWWTVLVGGAGPGTEYAFRVDGSAPLPDPRSPLQPDGVHGFSRVVDHGAFAWTDQDWRGAHLPSAVIYELHIGTYSPEGTFDGAIQRLDHIVELGITAVELLPVAEFPGLRNWGYDGVSLYAPHSGYGGPDGMKRFVDACHHRGLAVVLDVVYNHVGPEGNHLGRFGPYFTDFYATPWGQAVNFDRAGSDEVRRFVIDNALMWLRDYHVDGLRLDAVHAIVDTSAVHIVEQLTAEVEQLSADVGRPLFVIAESDLDDPRVVNDRSVGGWGCDAQWSDDFHHALHVALTGERDGYYIDFDGLVDLAAAFERTWPHAGGYSKYRERTHGRPHGGLPGWRFLAYAQNHDQVGNRAVGDRHSQSLSIGRLKVAAALYLLSPYVPLIFQGEEWAASTPFQYFTSHTDVELGRAVAQGRRSEFAAFGWKHEDVPDPQDPATFERSKLVWSERDLASHHEVLEWYRSCIALRRSTPELLDGRLDRVRAEADAVAGTISMCRGSIAVVANLGSETMRLPPGELLLASSAEVSSAVPPDAVAVVRSPARG